jgi:hypothetical protein
MKLFKDFARWETTNESLGDGREAFQQQLDKDKFKNVWLYGFPYSYGEDYDSIQGNLKFAVSFEVDSSGISSMEVNVEEIILEIVPVDSEGEKEDEIVVHFTSEVLEKCKIEVEVANFPLYLESVDVDLSNCEDADGEVDLTKAVITAKFGREE